MKVSQLLAVSGLLASCSAMASVSVTCSETALDGHDEGVYTYPQLKLTPGQSKDLQSNLHEQTHYLVHYHADGVRGKRTADAKASPQKSSRKANDKADSEEGKNSGPNDVITILAVFPDGSHKVETVQKEAGSTTDRAENKSIKFRLNDDGSFSTFDAILSDNTEFKCDVLQNN